jgi:chromosome segregation ATPase
MAITREQIYHVANALDSEGVRPTLAAVRRRLGCGSFTTLSEALNEWKLIHGARTLQKIQEPLPEQLLEKTQVLWSLALDLATHRFNQDKEAIEEKTREKENYYAELERLAEEHDKELKASKAGIEQLRQELTTLTQRLSVETDESKLLRQSLVASETARKVSERHSEELRTELDRAHQHTEQLQLSLATLTTGFESMQDRLLKQGDKSTKNNLNQSKSAHKEVQI